MIAVTILVNRDIWFVQTPTQVSRAIYGADPSRSATRRLLYSRQFSAVRALGRARSEPELYFLSRRHSVTGYIYTYGMMEAPAVCPGGCRKR